MQLAKATGFPLDISLSIPSNSLLHHGLHLSLRESQAAKARRQRIIDIRMSMITQRLYFNSRTRKRAISRRVLHVLDRLTLSPTQLRRDSPTKLRRNSAYDASRATMCCDLVSISSTRPSLRIHNIRTQLIDAPRVRPAFQLLYLYVGRGWIYMILPVDVIAHGQGKIRSYRFRRSVHWRSTRTRHRLALDRDAAATALQHTTHPRVVLTHPRARHVLPFSFQSHRVQPVCKVVGPRSMRHALARLPQTTVGAVVLVARASAIQVPGTRTAVIAAATATAEARPIRQRTQASGRAQL